MQDLAQGADSSDPDPLAARQVGVVGLGAPVPTAARGLGGASQSCSQHHGVGAASDGLDQVAAAANAAVSDHVHVAAPGLVQVVATSAGNIGDGGGHRGVDAKARSGGVGSATAEANQHAGSAGAHEVQGRGVGGGAAHDHGDVEFVDEALEVERFGAGRDVLRRDGGATDDEQVDASLHHGGPELLGALRGECTGHGHTSLTDLLDPFDDEFGLDGCRVQLLHPTGGVTGRDVGDLGEQRLGIVVAGPETFKVQHADAAKATQLDGGGRAHHRVHWRCNNGDINLIGVNLPRDRHVAWGPGTPTRDDRNVVKGVGATPTLATADFDLVAHGHPGYRPQALAGVDPASNPTSSRTWGPPSRVLCQLIRAPAAPRLLR